MKSWCASRDAMVARLFAPVDIAPLVWFRIVFGGLLVWEVIRYFQLGRVEDHFIAPAFHFSYYGFGWVTPWPASAMRLHFAVMGALAACVAMGAAYRITAPLFFLSFGYVFLLDQARYLNHFYLVCLFALLLALAPAHRAGSIDAWLRPGIRSATAPAWSLRMLQAQLCIVYFMGGIAKLNWDWLRGEPMRMWLRERTDFPLIGSYFDAAWAPYLFSFGGLAVDLALPVLLVFRRTRAWGFALAILFHVTNAWLFNIGIFPALALAATLILFSSEPLPRRWTTAGPERQPPSPIPWRRYCGAGLIALWLGLQVLVPLRHFVVYPGNPEWTEEGHRFSWRMKLRDKTGQLRLFARDQSSGSDWEIVLRDYLTQDQIDEAATRPDMILQLAHHVAAGWARTHRSAIAVHADARASLNGRPMQVLIDPAVNLAAEVRSLAPSSSIVPLANDLADRRR